MKYQLIGASVFQYISFRAAIATIFSMGFSLFFGKRIINFLRNQQIGETVRDLGLDGQKEKEGDGKTPEGKYYITHKNPNSKFYLSLGINFPNQSDKKRALQRGLNPGSDIFIHGLGKKNILLHYFFDWTEGCIAVTNREIEEIYSLVEPGTIIYIYA